MRQQETKEGGKGVVELVSVKYTIA